MNDQHEKRNLIAHGIVNNGEFQFPVVVSADYPKFDIGPVRLVRFPVWQHTHAGALEVRKALRKTLFDFKLHQDTELFDKAYGYVRQYY